MTFKLFSEFNESMILKLLRSCRILVLNQKEVLFAKDCFYFVLNGAMQTASKLVEKNAYLMQENFAQA